MAHNPSREIAFIIAATVALGAGMYAYLSSTMERPTPPKLAALSGAARVAERDTRTDDARRVATAFVQHLSAGRTEDAYAMMASAYREATSLEAFRAACGASPFLSSPTSVSLSRTREERAPGQAGRGSLSATGVLVTRSGTVDVTFFFVDDAAGVAVVNVNVAGTPALPIGGGKSKQVPAPTESDKKR
jgi:hypothetical protein